MITVRVLLASVGLLLIVSAACDETQRGVGPSDSVTVKLRIRETKTVHAFGVDLTFNGLINDSRCPMGDFCSWGGFAEIDLRLESVSDSLKLLIYADMDEPCLPSTKQDVAGLRLELISLEPYPDGFVPSDSDYVAVVRIEESNTAMPDPRDVILCNLQCGQLEILGLDSIRNPRIEDGQLKFTTAYSGRCADHKFYLYANLQSPELNPPQVDLYLRHFSEPDYCDAMRPIDLEFNLEQIREALPVYSSNPLTIQLNLHQPLDTLVHILTWTPPDTVSTSVLPMAVGNYWVYADSIATYDSRVVQWDTVAVIGTHHDSSGLWWVLNQSLLELGDTIMVRNDSVFSRQYGSSTTAWPSVEYVPSIGPGYTYTVQTDELTHRRTVFTPTRPVEVPVGLFYLPWEYTHSSTETGHYHHVLAPHIGFIYREKSPLNPHVDTVSWRRSWLVDYHLEPVVE